MPAHELQPCGSRVGPSHPRLFGNTGKAASRTVSSRPLAIWARANLIGRRSGPGGHSSQAGTRPSSLAPEGREGKTATRLSGSSPDAHAPCNIRRTASEAASAMPRHFPRPGPHRTYEESERGASRLRPRPRRPAPAAGRPRGSVSSSSREGTTPPPGGAARRGRNLIRTSGVLNR
jgi:hypothetical protein